MSDQTPTTTRWDELTEAGRQAVARGDLAAAAASYRDALVEAEATAPDSARAASSLASLGQVRYQAKDHAEAEQLFRRALALRERLLGAEHPTVAQTLNNLAAVHVALGALDAAEPLLLRALAITEKHRGPSHPDVAVNLNNLAKLYFKRSEHARAEPLLVRLLELERAAAPAHPKVASVLTSLANVKLAQGDAPAVEALLAEAESIVGAQHASVTAARARLEALRSGRLTPHSTAKAVDPAAVSGPVVMPSAPTPAASDSVPPRRPSRPLPPNPWLAESEPPSVIAAESGEYGATRPATAESHVIVPSTEQQPIAPPPVREAPAPLPPLVVPPQVPREFGDAWGGRAAGEAASVTATGRASVEMRVPEPDVTPGLVKPPAPPIVEAPSVRPAAAAPVTTAPPFTPPVAYAPPPAAAPLVLERDVAPMPMAPPPPAPVAPPVAAAPVAPAPAPRVPKAASSEGARLAEAPRARPAPRKPRLQPQGAGSSGGRGKLVVAAALLATLAGGGWLMLGGGKAAAPAEASPAAARGVALSAPAPSRDASTGVAAPDTATQPPIDEITSSPVPLARREPPEPKPARPAELVVPQVRVPVLSTDRLAGSIDSATKAKVEASLRPRVEPFARPAGAP